MKNSRIGNAPNADLQSATQVAGGQQEGVVKRLSGLENRRDQNIDLLRASAIAMVLIYHWVQRWPAREESVRAFTELGQYGVDLFFVISGWLIGGLYWRELKNQQTVQVRRFLLRRWLRTVPPYLAALPIAWAGVAITRGEQFDWRYLLFLQNYYERIPFFLVSWSLCVEEHFYLALPLVLWAAVRIHPRAARWLALVALVPLCLRVSADPLLDATSFGRHLTATHLRFEGLVLGVWAAWVSIHDMELWAKLKRLSRVLALPAAVPFLALALVGQKVQYWFGYSLVAVVFVIWLVRLSDEPPVASAKLSAVSALARWSYSIYLTHTFVEWPVLGLLRSRYPGAAPVWALVLVLATVVSGAVFFKCVEAPAMHLRDKWVPRSGVLIAGRRALA